MSKSYFAIVRPDTGKEATSFSTLAETKRNLSKYPADYRLVKVTDGDQQIVHLSKAERMKIYGTAT